MLKLIMVRVEEKKTNKRNYHQYADSPKVINYKDVPQVENPQMNFFFKDRVTKRIP